ncbi:hypothetical protein [Mesorhizobium sp. LNJC403B00]|uniref:hypothetical protein n=1 Tax=Mesorhizobium sp. LNJC403B00 TaxID=1287280 RepID=UPI0004183535|nr:hypothetical protein [Mesorhizobium sp. LNJC403B00]
MQYVYIVVIGLHVMAGVFWAGTTITLARDPEIRAERFIGPQMGSAGMVFVTGALLWYFFHGAYFGSMEMVLARASWPPSPLPAFSASSSARPAGSLPARTPQRKRRCAPKWPAASASPPGFWYSPYFAWRRPG